MDLAGVLGARTCIVCEWLGYNWRQYQCHASVQYGGDSDGPLGVNVMEILQRGAETALPRIKIHPAPSAWHVDGTVSPPVDLRFLTCTLADALTSGSSCQRKLACREGE